jgi:hypothetical protein
MRNVILITAGCSEGTTPLVIIKKGETSLNFGRISKKNKRYEQRR